uniref:Uncharacterized protein n=1 Tax=Panagrellus redivivus TaxID=6233 RepID=A0A7E4UN91_PANRE
MRGRFPKRVRTLQTGDTVDDQSDSASIYAELPPVCTRSSQMRVACKRFICTEVDSWRSRDSWMGAGSNGLPKHSVQFRSNSIFSIRFELLTVNSTTEMAESKL